MVTFELFLKDISRRSREKQDRLKDSREKRNEEKKRK
jgi:hypothetical protein